MLVQGALQQHLGDLIAVQAVEVEARDSTFRVTVRYVVLRDGTRPAGQLRGAGGGDVMFHCCDAAPARSAAPLGVEECDRVPRGARSAAPPWRSAAADAVRAAAAAGLHPRHRTNLRISGGERIPTVGIEWAAAADALPPQAEPGLVDDLDELDRTLVVRTTSSGDFSRYTLAIVAELGSDEPPADFDPRALLDCVLLQGRVSVGVRLRGSPALPAGRAPAHLPSITSRRTIRDSGA